MKLDTVRASKECPCAKGGSNANAATRNLRVKHILGLALLWTAHAAMPQEFNSVVYERIHAYAYAGKEKQKKPTKKALIADRKAQLIYSPTYLLFKSPQGTDTVFLSSIDKTSRNFPYGKMFYISYNNRSDFINLVFCEKTTAKSFKKFILEKGVRYRRNFALAFVYMPLTLFWPLDLFLDFSPPSPSDKWPLGCN